jgi:hypothetical protein
VTNEKDTGLLWPTMLLVGSLTNAAGMTAAITRGDANDSIAFRTGLFASIIYSTSHAIKVGQVLYSKWVEKVAAGKEDEKLKEVVIERY